MDVGFYDLVDKQTIISKWINRQNVRAQQLQ